MEGFYFSLLIQIPFLNIQLVLFFALFFIKYFQGGKINSLDFHRKDDLLVTASEDDSVRLYDIANAKLVFLLFLFSFLLLQ